MASERRLLLAAVFVAACTAQSAVASSARAQPLPDESVRAAARAAMEEGYDRLEHGDAQRALESFLAADDRMHVPTTGLAVATALAQLGRLLEARARAAAILAQPLARKAPRAFVLAYADAARLLADLDARTPILRIVSGATRVMVDGEAVAPQALVAGRGEDPGPHTIVAFFADGASVVSSVTLAERESRTVDIPPTAASPAAVAAPSRGSSSAGSATSPHESGLATEALSSDGLAPAHGASPAHDASSPSSGPSSPPSSATPRSSAATMSPPASNGRAMPWIIAGASIAAAGAVVGLGAGYVALVHRNAAAAACGSEGCPPASFGDIQAAQTYGTVSTIAFVGAGAGAALAVGALLLSAAPPRAPSSGARVSPVIGAGAAGVRVEF